MNTKFRDLQNRINQVINSSVFEEVLGKYGYGVMDFQGDWPEYGDFESLPPHYQEAILEAEKVV